MLTAIENLVIPKVQQTMKSLNASSGRGADSIVLDPDQTDFSGNIEGFQMTALSRISSHTDLDETRGNITVEGSDLSANEKNYWPVSTHYSQRFLRFNAKLSKLNVIDE